MAWSMPPTGQWGPGMGVTPDVNMGNYTAEQWTAMQQQSWQQWTQWQQQYASWQSQCGSKYAEQMQAMQTMGAVPPLPPSSSAPPPPAPPPPDKPPPPPHENNQPLYGNTQLQAQQPAPVLAPVQNSALPNISAEMTGNTLNWNQQPDACLEASVNSEALKTLAEEQKAFDIQFQKWEEEFEKWKKENVNHPDKQAYKEYEQKFEACKAQLLERRKQMKQKKAKLLNNIPQTTTSNAFRKNVAPLPVPAVPPPVHNTSSNTYMNNEQTSYPPQNYNKNFSQNSQYNNMSQYYGRDNDNKNYEPRDRQESYSNENSNKSFNSSNLISTEPFLPTSQPPKGIPGLDLVPEPDKFVKKPQAVIDITDDEKQFRSHQQAPDYSKISKGINNILGDETIMNILSMVRGQAPPPNNAPINNSTINDSSFNNPSINNQGSYGNVDSGNNRPNNFMGRNEAYNNNYGTGRGQNLSNVKQSNEYNMHQENTQTSKYSTPPPQLYQQRSDLPQNQYNARNPQYKSQGLLPRPGMQQNVRPNVPLRSLLDPILPQNDYALGGMDTRGMGDDLPPQTNLGIRPNLPARPSPPVRPSWAADPLFTPSIIVEYEHKPLRLKARDFIEPVHTFHYNHKSKDSDVKKKDFEKEAEELFTRHPRVSEREDRYSSDRLSRDLYYRNNDRTGNKEGRDFRDDSHLRGFREEFEERRRFDDDRRRFDDDFKDRRFEDRRRDDRDKYYRREDLHRERDRDDVFRERERDLERIRARERDMERSRERDRDRGSEHNRERDANRDRDKNRDFRKSRSHDRDSRKRGHSRDSELSSSSNKKVKDAPLNNTSAKPKHTVMIDDLLEMPGRQMRPEKIVIILRGPPGSGKSYLAKLIRDREAEQGGTVRVMSIDDYFMQEGEIEEKDPATGKIVKKPSLQYEYDEKLEETYLSSLKRAFKRSLTDGYFTFLIYDAVNDQLRSYADIWNFARQNGFQVYICTMDLDPQTCFKRNTHNRRLEEIEVISSRFFPTPDHHIQLDPTTLLQSASIRDVQMEDADDDITMEDAQDTEVDSSFTSKWEKMEDAEQLARLDGTSRPLRPSRPSMEDYLQLDDWAPAAARPGKKTVRWADIEERRQQEKMRAIGFVVGQTDWTRMTDPTMGSGALTQTKYIERVRR